MAADFSGASSWPLIMKIFNSSLGEIECVTKRRKKEGEKERKKERMRESEEAEERLLKARRIPVIYGLFTGVEFLFVLKNSLDKKRN